MEGLRKEKLKIVASQEKASRWTGRGYCGSEKGGGEERGQKGWRRAGRKGDTVEVSGNVAAASVLAGRSKKRGKQSTRRIEKRGCDRRDQKGAVASGVAANKRVTSNQRGTSARVCHVQGGCGPPQRNSAVRRFYQVCIICVGRVVGCACTAPLSRARGRCRAETAGRGRLGVAGRGRGRAKEGAYAGWWVRWLDRAVAYERPGRRERVPAQRADRCGRGCHGRGRGAAGGGQPGDAVHDVREKTTRRQRHGLRALRRRPRRRGDLARATEHQGAARRHEPEELRHAVVHARVGGQPGQRDRGA